MKLARILSLFVVLALVLAAVPAAYAQLGQSDNSSFTVQNVDSTDAQVTVYFIDATGNTITPTTLNAGKTNPFTLTPGQSFEVYVPGIPSTQLPSGRYSVVIESTAQVVAIANLIGSGPNNFNGSYSGFSGSDGAPSFFLPAVVFNYYGWYSMISVQNAGSGATDITVTIKCQNGTTGTLSQTALAAGASRTFVLKDTDRPTGFLASTVCNGSATVTSTGSVPIVAIDNQSVPTAGNTQSYNGVADGATNLYVPALYTAYFGWNASLNIQKIAAGTAAVTVEFSDNAPNATCNLTDAQPSCLLYMPSAHPTAGYFGAKIVSDNGTSKLVAVVNAANGVQAQTYDAIATATGSVGIPSVMKNYYGWNTSFTCQNVSQTATALHISYDNSKSYDTTKTLAFGESLEVYQPTDLSEATYQGGVTVTANASGALISCIVNFNNGANMGNPATSGDWSMSYNAFNR